MVEFLNRQQVVERYPLVLLSQLEAHGANGTGPSYYRIGREYFYTPPDIEQWLERFRHEATPPVQREDRIKSASYSSALNASQELNRNESSRSPTRGLIGLGPGRPRKSIKPSPLFSKSESDD